MIEKEDRSINIKTAKPDMDEDEERQIELNVNKSESFGDSDNSECLEM